MIFFLTYRFVDGLPANQMANSDIMKLAKSVNKWAASVAIAKLFDKTPPVKIESRKKIQKFNKKKTKESAEKNSSNIQLMKNSLFRFRNMVAHQCYVCTIFSYFLCNIMMLSAYILKYSEKVEFCIKIKRWPKPQKIS